MPLPAGVETVTVSGTLTRPDGTWCQGSLRFTAPDVATVAEDNAVLGGPVDVALVDGAFSVTLAATDATGIDPTGWTYKVEGRFTNAPNWTRYIELPKAVPAVNLADILIADPVDGAVASLVSESEIDTRIAAHAADTTAVHGIADTTALETQAGATAKVSTHAAATDPHADRAYTDTQIAALSALTQLKVKTADEPRTSTTTVSDDGHLFASLEANSTYRFRAMLLFDGPEAADASITFTVPSGASGGWSPVAGTLGTTVPDGSAQIKMAARQFGSNSDVGVMASSATLAGLMVLPHGIVVTGATPGLLRLRWAQQTSNATAVNLKAGSTLEVVKVSGAGPSASGINLDYPASYPSDQGLLAWTYDPDIAGHVTAQSNAGVAGRVTLTKIQIRKSITWANIWFGLSGLDAGATLSNCYLGVYNAAGTRVGVTVDISADLMTGAVAKAVALTAPFTAAPGEYFIAMLLNGTWTTNALHFKASGAGISVNANLTAPRLRYSNMLTGQTSLPASLDLTQQSTSIINTGWASQWYGVS